MKRAAINIWLIARTILLEAVRRREIYVIVLVAGALIAGLREVHFFHIPGLSKFYREVALRTMNVATALTAVLLAARQLPREFRYRTLYPLLAKPVSRLEFLLGKFAGVMFAVAFCYALFMGIFLVANLALRNPLRVELFLQSVYLQAWSAAVLVALTLLLSLVLNADAAITVSLILYAASQVLMTLLSFLYDQAPGWWGRFGLLALHYIIPQLTLFDASARVVHPVWPAVPAWAMATLTLYGAFYTLLYLTLAYLVFRKKAL